MATVKIYQCFLPHIYLSDETTNLERTEKMRPCLRNRIMGSQMGPWQDVGDRTAESLPKGYLQDIHIPGDLTNQSWRGGVREVCQERIPKGSSEEKYGKPISLTANKSTPVWSPSKPGPGPQHVLLRVFLVKQEVIHTLKIRSKTKKTLKRMNLSHFNSSALPFTLEPELMRF